MNHRSPLLSCFGLALLAACSGPNRPPVGPTGGPQVAGRAAAASAEVAGADAASAARSADVIRAQIALDRKAIEVAQQSVSHLDGLYAAGRATRGEVLEAEIALLEHKRQLHLHEQELAALGEAASAPAGEWPDGRD